MLSQTVLPDEHFANQLHNVHLYEVLLVLFVLKKHIADDCYQVLGPVLINVAALERLDNWVENGLVLLDHKASAFLQRTDISQNVGYKVEHLALREV